MKKLYKLIPLFVMVAMVGSSSILMAQDTLVVEWLSEDQSEVLQNSLYETIIADTNSSGERIDNRVYKLKQGGFYYIQESIQNDGWHLNIVGEKGDPSDALKNPPMLQITGREDATVTGKMFNVRGNFTLKNVIVNGRTTDGGLQYEILDIRADGGRFTFDNVIFEYAQWGIMGIYSAGADLFYTNNTVRNFISETQPWGCRGFSIWSDIDTVWVENNTFLNVGAFTGQIEGASANYFFFNHNTVVNNGRQVLLWMWVKDGFFTNNLILNGFWQGEDRTQISDIRLASDDQQYSGMIAIDNIPSQYGLDAERRFVVANNAFHLEDEYTTYFTTDNDTFDIRKQPLFSVEVENLFAEFDNMVAKDNMEDQGEPGFTTYADNHQERIDFVTDLRNANSPIALYYWDPSRDASNESIQWPLPEDLEYTNTTYKAGGITGYPLGDLNWFPTEKAAWEVNKNSEYQAILDNVGDAPEVAFQGSVEGETGTFTSDAGITAAPDRNLARIEAAGNIVWDDVSMTAGTYDVEVSHRTWYADESTARQTDIVVNGGSAIPIQIGEIQDGVSWSSVTAANVAFTEGSNSIALNRSWGYMEYQWVKIKEAGTENVVATLWPGEATLDGGGTFICSDTEGLCGSGDNFANTNTGGSVTISFDSPGTGNYLVRLNYFLIDGDTDVELSVNGSSQTMETLAGDDSTVVSFDFTNIPLSLGANEIQISASSGGVAVDFIDFFSVGTLSVSNENEDKVKGFELSQNYPNPFNPSTNINFTLPVASNVQLTVFNLLGQKVATLVSERRTAGNHTVRFDARSLSSGIYFYQLQAGDFTLQRKMTLIK